MNKIYWWRKKKKVVLRVPKWILWALNQTWKWSILASPGLSMDESYCMANTAFYVGMLSPACSPAQSCMQSSVEVMRCWAQHLRPDSTVWPDHPYCVWPCQAHQKYSCTVRSIIGLQQMDYIPGWSYLPIKNLGSKKIKLLGTLPR